MANENLTCNITAALANVTSACSATDLSELAFAASDNADTNRQISVAKSADLPDLLLNNIPEGTIMFLENYNVPVIATKTSWEGLDGQIIRKDKLSYCAFGWGLGSWGQIGAGNNFTTCSPTSTIGNIVTWCDISTTNNSTIAVKTDGTMWSWGSGQCGKLGDGTIIAKCSPVSVVGGFRDWKQISGGCFSAGGIRVNGTLWTWGLNACGILGDATVANKSSPVSVVGGFTDWSQLSMGAWHSAGIRMGGTAWTWGTFARLGDNKFVDSSSPVSVVGGFTDWCQISAGYEHSLALRTNGTLWSWGNNYFGILGDNTTTNRRSPVSVVGGFTDWCQISAGKCHSIALRNNGTAWSWGRNLCGELGNGTTVSSRSPISVVGGFTDWCQINAGAGHTTILKLNGTIWSWGFNSYGQLGDGTIINKSSPVSISSNITTWCDIAKGSHSCFAMGIAVL